METSRTAPGPEAEAWIREAKAAAGQPADVRDCIGILDRCPGSFRDSPDFGWWCGWCTGRLTQIDRVLGQQDQESERQFMDAQQTLYAAVKPWVLFEPSVFCCAAAFVSPAAVFGLFDDGVWPQELLRFRPFWMGWFAGQLLEGEESAARVFAMEGVQDVFAAALASHRRPGAGPSLI